VIPTKGLAGRSVLLELSELSLDFALGPILCCQKLVLKSLKFSRQVTASSLFARAGNKNARGGEKSSRFFVDEFQHSVQVSERLVLSVLEIRNSGAEFSRFGIHYQGRSIPEPLQNLRSCNPSYVRSCASFGLSLAE